MRQRRLCHAAGAEHQLGTVGAALPQPVSDQLQMALATSVEQQGLWFALQCLVDRGIEQAVAGRSSVQRTQVDQAGVGNSQAGQMAPQVGLQHGCHRVTTHCRVAINAVDFAAGLCGGIQLAECAVAAE